MLSRLPLTLPALLSPVAHKAEILVVNGMTAAITVDSMEVMKCLWEVPEKLVRIYIERLQPDRVASGLLSGIDIGANNVDRLARVAQNSPHVI